MTKAEYERLYRQARDSWPGMTREMMVELKKTYQAAADATAAVMRDAQLRGLSELTTASQAALTQSLQKGANEIAATLEELMPEHITNGYDTFTPIDIEYMTDAVAKAGVGDAITAAGLKGTTVAVNQRLIQAMVTRDYQDGYTFSTRIWGDLNDRGIPIGVYGDYQYRIKQVVGAGLAQGRDVVKIAKDIQVYVADGKIKLVQRYGSLKAGTAEFIKRISGQVDWRALRLARSELYASMQEASLHAGRVNPAVTKQYNWVLTPGADHDCICPELAAASPYGEDEVPEYPHPNCLCHVLPILMDGREFVADLERWGAGESVGYLDEWYTGVYQPAQAAA